MKDILIGNTPVVRLTNTNIYVKLEKYNAGGSIKDRAVLGMLLDAIEKKIIDQDSILIEATSGNTGIALAMLGAVYGYKVVIIMPETMSVERRALVKAYGAELILSEGSKGMQGAMDLMKEMMEKDSRYVSLGQFENPANPQIHYETTGKELLDQVKDIGVFVSCVGTGGTFSGIARRLKEFDSSIVCVAGEPDKSALLSGERAGSHRIQGIGANFIPDNFKSEYCDEVMRVSDEEAFEQAKAFAKDTGILVGISSGANVALAKKLAERYPDKNIVTIAPDGGEKYLSVLYQEG